MFIFLLWEIYHYSRLLGVELLLKISAYVGFSTIAKVYYFLTSNVWQPISPTKYTVIVLKFLLFCRWEIVSLHCLICISVTVSLKFFYYVGHYYIFHCIEVSCVLLIFLCFWSFVLQFWRDFYIWRIFVPFLYILQIFSLGLLGILLLFRMFLFLLFSHAFFWISKLSIILKIF